MPGIWSILVPWAAAVVACFALAAAWRRSPALRTASHRATAFLARTAVILFAGAIPGMVVLGVLPHLELWLGPTAKVIPAATAVSALWWIPYLRRRHAEREAEIASVGPDRCPFCGYDCRVTPANCPECGATRRGAHRHWRRPHAEG